MQNIHNNCTLGILSVRFVKDKHFVPTRWNVEDRDRPSVPTAPWNLIRESDARHLANLPKSTTLSLSLSNLPFLFFSFLFFPVLETSATINIISFLFQLRSFVSLVQPLVKLLDPPSRVYSCVVRREYRVLDLSRSQNLETMIPLISLLFEFSF